MPLKLLGMNRVKTDLFFNSAVVLVKRLEVIAVSVIVLKQFLEVL